MPDHDGDLASLPLFANSPHFASPTPAVADPPHSGSPADPSHWTKRVTRGRISAVASTVSSWKGADSGADSVSADQANTTTESPGTVDWHLVRELREEVARQRASRTRDAAAMSLEEEGELGRQIVAELVQDHVDAVLASSGMSIDRTAQLALQEAVEHAVFGMGRLQPLLDDSEIENIELFGADGVIVEYADGRLEQVAPIADSDEDLVEDLNFVAANSPSGNAREFSAASPQLHMRLPDGSRLAASMSISPRPQVTIRRHRLRKVTFADLVGRNMLSDEAAEFLRAAVQAQKTIMIAGPQGGGKTTFLRACCAAMDPWENIGTIESEYELHLHELRDQHRRIRAWEARPGTGEISPGGRRAGEVTMDDLTESVWRHNLDRLILGEVRGREAAALMKVISGIQGAMWTVHAPSARAAIERMVTLMMEAGQHVTVDFARRQVNAHVDLIVQIGVTITDRGQESNQRFRNRYVSEIVAVEEGEAGQAAITDLFTAVDRSFIAIPQHAPPPRLLRDLQMFGDYRGAATFISRSTVGV